MDSFIYVHLVLLISYMMALHSPCSNFVGLAKPIIAWTCFNTYEGVIECLSQLLSVSNQSSVIVEQLHESFE
jgi:hypothetical protein